VQESQTIFSYFLVTGLRKRGDLGCSLAGGEGSGAKKGFINRRGCVAAPQRADVSSCAIAQFGVFGWTALGCMKRGK